MIQRVDTIETVVDVFNIAMDIQELYLKQGPFKQLSMSEMHVLEAVDKESSTLNVSCCKSFECNTWNSYDSCLKKL